MDSWDVRFTAVGLSSPVWFVPQQTKGKKAEQTGMADGLQEVY